MKRYRYTRTDEFKVGDQVWLSGIKFTPGGRSKYSIRPTLVKVSKVEKESIVVEGYIPYSVPTRYYMDNPNSYNDFYNSYYVINKNIAKTKEEAIENFNFRVQEEIENHYLDFRNFEKRALTYLM